MRWAQDAETGELKLQVRGPTELGSCLGMGDAQVRAQDAFSAGSFTSPGRTGSWENSWPGPDRQRARSAESARWLLTEAQKHCVRAPCTYAAPNALLQDYWRDPVSAVLAQEEEEEQCNEEESGEGEAGASEEGK